MKLGTQLQKNDREVRYEIWNDDSAVTSISEKTVSFSIQTIQYPTEPRKFEEKDLEHVREIAKTYNAKIVQVTTTTVKVQERKLLG